jgi:hypothetical protein
MLFPSFPNHTRVWIYAAKRPFTVEEHEYICARLKLFIEQWQAHGKQLKSGFEIVHKRFIIIAVDEDPQNATGCSIDACVRELQSISKDLNLDLFDRMQVIYRDTDNNMVVSCSIAELKEMIAEGDFTPDTPVFNNSITTLGDLRIKWETTANSSWVNRYFKTTPAQ